MVMNKSYLFLHILDPLVVLFGGRAPPQDILGSDEPEEIVEEGDGQKKDGHQPPVLYQEPAKIHSSDL